ncbi:FlgO family outer membrane protein [Pseudoalteromonas spongiae]|uniref:FlgO family outer membrane protein n=1 Tax=Pseudoalteromonas spongiae TaxID=298657 RepID=UPI003736EDCB
MKHLIAGVAILASGCQTTVQQSQEQKKVYPVAQYQPANRIAPINDYLLDEYAEQIAMKLMANLDAEPELVRLAVTSFVDLDDNLQYASRFGNQLAESMLTEVQAYGLNVVDHKVMPVVRIDGNGDYTYSRDVKQLNSQGVINAVLSGTLLYKGNGVVVNSRITSLSDQRIIASAKYTIPYSVAFDE